MGNTNTEIIEKTVEFVKETLAGAEGGHDWWHIYRVWNNAKLIMEGEDVDGLVVELGALLHDIADSKFHNGDEEVGPRVAREFLVSLSLDSEIIGHVENILRHISFSSSFNGQKWSSPELAVVQDADRLDSLGAIGVARTFIYGGFKGACLYNPNIPPKLGMTKEEYKESQKYQDNQSSVINHFYEKLLLLKDRMNTKTGKRLAEDRHRYTEGYLEQFYAEWEGTR